MNKLRKLLLALIVALGFGVAHAQVSILTDIGVTMTAVQTADLQVGQPVELTLTVTNYGPVVAPLIILQSSMFFREFTVLSVNQNECYPFGGVVVDGVTPSSFLVWYVAGIPDTGNLPLQVGETRTCHFQIALTPQSPSTVSFTFAVSSYDPDINPSNDSATVILQRAFPIVPVLSPLMLTLLAGVIASAALGAMKARATNPLRG